MPIPELQVISLGANPATPDTCRIHDGSFHVNYIIDEVDDDEKGYYQYEIKNVTHREVSVLNDEEMETAWIVEVEEDKAHLAICENEDFGFDIDQHISAQTCLQLADMFTRAAHKIFEFEAAKEAEEKRIQKIIDSQKLPFEEMEN